MAKKVTMNAVAKKGEVIRLGKRPQEITPGKPPQKIGGPRTVDQVVSVKNTTLDDIASVVGFTAACRLSHWYGDGMKMYVPEKVDDEHRLARLLGLPAARRLSDAWGGEHLAIPSMRNHEVDIKRRHIGRLFELGLGSKEISNILRMGERRVQQVCRELELQGLLPVIGPLKEKEVP